MYKKMLLLVGFVLSMAIVTNPSYGASAYYEGKTVRIIVGHSAGGGFDTYARMVGRHLGKHLPGIPSVVVENMVGAGSLIAAKHLYSIAKPDGLTLGTLTGQIVMAHILGREGVDIDTRRFEWIGEPVQDHVVVVFTKASGITSMDKWIASTAPVKIGGTAPGDTTVDVPRILNTALGLPMQLVEGYKGTAQIRLASETGEVHGSCWQWESVRVTWSRAIESGDVVVALQITPKPLPDLPNVPLAVSYAKTDEARELIKMGVYEPATITRPYFLPPGTPKEQVQMLRKAFQETVKDPDFLAEAGKARLAIDPMTGEEIGEVVKSLFNMSPGLKMKLKNMLYPKR